MASKTEGISLLSMYNDDDDEEEEEQEQDQHQQLHQHQQEEDDSIATTRVQNDKEADKMAHDSASEHLTGYLPTKSPQNLSFPSPEIKSLRSPTPPPWPKSQRSKLTHQVPSSSPTPIPESVNVQKRIRGAIGIVDYEHDEAAISPEYEEGEIVSAGGGVVGMEIQTSDGNLEERTPPGSVRLLTPNTQPEPPQPSNLPEVSRSETAVAIDSTGIKPKIAEAEIARVVSEEAKIDDPLNSFLPPVLSKCAEELQEKISKFLAYKKAGKNFNEALRNRKDYRNPDFLQHAVRYQDIDQIGTCFSRDVFDPHGYDKSDYHDEIEADMKREIEREHERKRIRKLNLFLVEHNLEQLLIP